MKSDDFLELATGKNGAQSLRVVHHKPDFSFATNGFCLHAVQRENKIPDPQTVIETIAGREYLEVTVNPKFLLNALSGGPDDAVVIRIYKSDDETEQLPIELYFSGSYALIMPMNKQRWEHWRPWQPGSDGSKTD